MILVVRSATLVPMRYRMRPVARDRSRYRLRSMTWAGTTEGDAAPQGIQCMCWRARRNIWSIVAVMGAKNVAASA